jgi:hypothetical protein
LAKRLNGRTVVDPERPTVSWAFALRGERLRIDRWEGGLVEQFIADYAFGSGHHATTFVSVIEPSRPTALEHRLTHFSQDDLIGITPGQRSARKAAGVTPRGRELAPAEAVQCFDCHSTRLRPGFDPNALTPNVSCERCHGPARAHVEAARAGAADLALPSMLSGNTSDSLMRMCGACHRLPANVPARDLRPGNETLARFQTVGLMMSRCYTQSGGALSCLTCHDPHARPSRDRATYEAACLKCHQGPSRTICATDARAGCIECHMPRVDTGQRIFFADHWIRVRDPATANPIEATPAQPASSRD